MIDSNKIDLICQTIKTNISIINTIYKRGPDLYFYKKVYDLRQSQNITRFLKSDYNIEILYATLVSWNMNSRRAKMLYYDEFKENLLYNAMYLKEIEAITNEKTLNIALLIHQLDKVYDNLDFMKTNGRLVSNSKVLHFLFPELLLPMDRTNTLQYFYDSPSESKFKFLEIIDISIGIMHQQYNWNAHLDNKWNTTIPKMIDNAIILLVRKSITDNG